MRVTRLTKLLSWVAMASVTAFTGRASAQTVFVNDTFDTYADQAAFEAVWEPIGGFGGTPPAYGSLGPMSGTLSTDQAVSGAFSVKIENPAAAVPPENSTSAYSQRNQLQFGETGTVTTTMGIRFSFDFYDEAPTASPFRHHVNLQNNPAPASTNDLISLGMNNNQNGGNSGGQFYMARILGYTVPTGVGSDPDGGPDESVGGAGAYFKLNDFGAPHRTLGWHNLRVDITTDDGLSTDYDFYVDNILVERVHNVGTAAQLRSYDTIRLGSGTSSGQFAWYDNMLVETFSTVVTPTDNADFDGDGDIDGADFLTWQRGVEINDGSALLEDGDANDDGNVNGDDLAIWKGQFGTSTVAAQAIPEPASLALAGLALVAGVAASCRRR